MNFQSTFSLLKHTGPADFVLKLKNEFFKWVNYIRKKRVILHSYNLLPGSVLLCILILILSKVNELVNYNIALVCSIPIIFTLIGMYFDLIIRESVLNNDWQSRFILIFCTIAILIATSICAGIILLAIFKERKHEYIFIFYLICQHYGLLLSLRKFIKLSNNEMYRHFSKIIVLGIVLFMPILSIGSYRLTFNNKSLSKEYSYADIFIEGSGLSKENKTLSKDEYVIFAIISTIGVYSINDLIEKCNNKVYKKVSLNNYYNGY